jgi:hypothetical protein
MRNPRQDQIVHRYPMTLDAIAQPPHSEARIATAVGFTESLRTAALRQAYLPAANLDD